MKILQHLSKDYTQQHVGLSINLKESLDTQEEAIKAWFSLPWDGSIPIPGWEFELERFFKSDEGVENFLIFNATGHTYYYPLVKLGCAVPMGLLVPKKGVKASAINEPIFRACILNTMKLYFISKERDSSNLDIRWASLMEATGANVVKEIEQTLRQLLSDGVITSAEKLRTDIEHSEPDAMDFPSSQSSFLSDSILNKDQAPKRGWGYNHHLDTSYKIDAETKQWVEQFIMFCKAKISFVRGITQSSHHGSGDSITAGLLQFKGELLEGGMNRVTNVLCKYLLDNPEERVRWASDLGVAASLEDIMIDPARLSALFKNTPPVWSTHCNELKVNALNKEVTNVGKFLESAVSVVNASILNITAMKYTRREIHEHLNTKSPNLEAILAGRTCVKANSVCRAAIHKLNPAFTLSYGEKPRSPYEMGVPDTDEARAILVEAGIDPLDPIFWPRNLLERGLRYLQTAKDFREWKNQQI